MSVFKVQLNNIEQGLLDLDPSTHPLASSSPSSTPATYGVLGEPFGEAFPNSGDASLQRQIFVTGPNLTYRLLSDGEQFTDDDGVMHVAVVIDVGGDDHHYAARSETDDEGEVGNVEPPGNVIGHSG